MTTHQNKTPSAGKLLGASQKTVWRHCIAAVAKDLLPWWLAGAAVAVVLAHCSNGAHASQSAKAQSVGRARATVSVALKGAGARNTQQLAVATPTVKRGFVTSQSLAGAAASGLHGLGRDGAIRKDARTTSCVLRTSRPPYALRKATGGFKSQLGASTMSIKSNSTATGASLALPAVQDTTSQLHELHNLLRLCAFAAEARRTLREISLCEERSMAFRSGRWYWA